MLEAEPFVLRSSCCGYGSKCSGLQTVYATNWICSETYSLDEYSACCWRRSEEYTLRFSEAEVLSYVEPTVWDARNRIIITKLYTILIRSIVQRPGPALVRKRQKKGPRNIIRWSIMRCAVVIVSVCLIVIRMCEWVPLHERSALKDYLYWRRPVNSHKYTSDAILIQLGSD